MKKKFLFYSAIVVNALLSSCANAQFLQSVSKTLDTATPDSFSESEAVEGIKEALIKGITEGVNLVSVMDGYFGNPEIKIPFPSEAATIESNLRAVGLGKQVDKAVLSINRAAEDAAKEARPIFVAAIKGMGINDAIGIVRGQNNEATQYLRNTTSPELMAKFQPVIKNSLDKVDATKYWTDIMNTYNKIPFVQKMNPDLAAYVTNKAIEGLFVMIAKEELKIRKDPLAQTSELLKKVFGH
jgi:hypothetical protein